MKLYNISSDYCCSRHIEGAWFDNRYYDFFMYAVHNIEMEKYVTGIKEKYDLV